MAIVPEIDPPVLTLVPDTAPGTVPDPIPTRGFEGRRWPCMLYPGELAQLGQMRRDLRRDLARLIGMTPDLAEGITLCASELFANASDYSRSGEPDGHLIRTLTMPTAHILRLGVIDDGHRAANPAAELSGPAIPTDRSLTEWEEAERGRGLLLVEHLAACWGSRSVLGFPFCEGVGTFLWAEFALPTTPPDPPRPPLPRRPRRPHSHRKPRHRRRSRAGRHLLGYTLATLAGALAHHLAPLLP